MKRVYCLYRVSTLGQVEKDDIPMQRQACHGFAHEKGWQIIEEFTEKGISGYKRSADQREALHPMDTNCAVWGAQTKRVTTSMILWSIQKPRLSSRKFFKCTATKGRGRIEFQHI